MSDKDVAISNIAGYYAGYYDKCSLQDNWPFEAEPMIGINSLPATNHQPEFAAHCITEAADQALVHGAMAMAWTAIDIATTATIRNRLLGVMSPA